MPLRQWTHLQNLLRTDLAKNNILPDTYLVGVGVSPGIVIGEVFLLDRSTGPVQERPVPPEEIAAELDRFRAAVSESREQLLAVKERVGQQTELEHIYIIDTHLLILDDQHLLGATEDHITTKLINAEAALSLSLDTLRNIFDAIDDEYLRERRSDIDFVGERILRNLAGISQQHVNDLTAPSIVVARDLSPADTMQIDKSRVLAFVTDFGGRTSHTAIIARSLGIPAVVGLESITQVVPAGTRAIVDGGSGTIILNPEDDTLAHYRGRQQEFQAEQKKLLSLKRCASRTRDRHSVSLKGNIEFVDELDAVHRFGGDGIGLFRSEFLFMNRVTPPSEEEQYQVYREVVSRVAPLPVTIRTLDIGGDKFVQDLNLANEQNPAMGLRGIRFSLKERNLLTIQLRALLRASALGKLNIMVPMVSTVQEVHETKALIAEIKQELFTAGIPYDPEVRFGIMIEVPSAALTADLLARHVDFFSVGTNDLIQYCLATDRGNEHVAYLYDQLNPAIIRALRMICEAAAGAGIGVGMCGEMAGDPTLLPVLVGLGFTDLSMTPNSILGIKKVLRGLDHEECRTLVDDIRQAESSEVISLMIENYLAPRFPELYKAPDFT